MQMLKDLQEWLTKHSCHDVRPVRVEIQGEVYHGCYYKQRHTYDKGMRCVQDGTKKAGDTYEEEVFYLVGSQPICYQRSSHVCFTFEDEHEWYVSGWIKQENINKLNETFHPFGAHFMMRPWDIPNSKIDDGERAPYKRIPMTVFFL